MLTTRNKQAIDLYLSPDERYQGNGTACWMEIYATESRKTAAANWAPMLGNASAQVYLEQRQREIDAERAKLIAYEQAEAVRDFLAIQRAAMQMVNRGRVARKVKRKDPDTGEETEEVEYADVHGMLDPGEAIRATEGAIRVQGKHPDQRAEGAGVMVNINIDTQWRGRHGASPIDVTGEAPDEPIDVAPGNGNPESRQADGLPVTPVKTVSKVVWIPRHASTMAQEYEVELREDAAPAVIIERPSAEGSPPNR